MGDLDVRSELGRPIGVHYFSEDAGSYLVLDALLSISNTGLRYTRDSREYLCGWCIYVNGASRGKRKWQFKEVCMHVYNLIVCFLDHFRSNVEY